ncbi:MAG: [LysW]-aminoadipate/[LysW]-glutamate kinase [Candidatus Methanomethyliaceae archaeon]
MKIVIKIGGDLLKEDKPNISLIEDLKDFSKKESIIIVHGGGDRVTEIATKLGKEQKFVISPEGFKSRYTDRETVEIYAMVMAGEINTKIVGILQSYGINAIGLSGFDGGLLRAKRKERIVIIDEEGRKRAIDGGFTGKITLVNEKLLELIIVNGYVPVISPLAMGENFEPLNVDGDRTASAIAKAIKADYLIFLTDVEGVIIDNKIINKIRIEEIEKILKKIGPGMSTKVHAAIEAVKNGVNKAIITSGFIDNPLKRAIEERSGTIICH